MARPRPAGSIGVLALLVAVLATGGAVAWAVGAVASRTREMAVSALSTATGRQVSIGRVSGTPWSGLVLDDVSIAAARASDPPPLVARRITLYFDPWTLARDLVRGRDAGASIAQVLFDEPALRVERNPAGAWNVFELLPRPGGRAAPSSFAGRVIVLNGTVTLTDRQRIAPHAFDARFVDLAGSADFAQSPRIALRASFVEERDGRRVAGRLSGAYTMSTRILDIDVSASGADAGAWGPYILTAPAFRVTGGQFDTSLHVLHGPFGGRWTTDYSGRIVLRDGRGSFIGRPATLTGVAGEIAVVDLTFSTTRLRGALNGSPLEVRGEVSFYGEPRFDLAVRSPGLDLTTVGRLFFPGVSHRITGVARGEVRITGPMDAPRMMGRIEAARGQIDRQPFERASADIALYGQMMSLTGIRGSTGGGRLSGNAWWLIDVPDFFLTLQLNGTDAAAVRQWSPTALPAFDGRVAGSITMLRRGSDLSVAGQAAVSDARVSGVDLDVLDAAFRSDRTGIAVDHLLARRGPSWAVARGHLDPGGALALDANGGEIDLAALPGLPSQGAVSGRAYFAGRLLGTADAPELAGTIQASDGRIGGLSYDAAAGRIVLRRGHLELDSLTARAAHARYRAAGRIQWGEGGRLALDLEAERASAETLSRAAGLPLAVTGRVNGRVRLEGPTARPQASGSIALRQATAYGQSIDAAAAAFTWDGTRLTVEGGSLQRGPSVVRFAGTFDRRTGFGVDVFAQGFDLRDLSLSANGAIQVDGHVEMTGRMTGSLAAPVMAADVRSSDLTINGRRFDQASGVIRWEARTLSLAPLALRLGDERYEITGEVARSGTPRASLAATVTDGRLSTLLGLGNARLGVPLDGVVTGTVRVEGPLANPAARLDLRFTRGRFGEHPLVEGHFDLTLRDRSVTIEEFELRPLQGRIAASGRYDLGGESQIEISGTDLDLDLLRPVFRFRRPLAGRLGFTMQLGGTLTSPEIGFALDIVRGGLQGGVTFDSFVANAYYRDGLLQVPQALLVQSGHKLRASGSMPLNPTLLRFDEHSPLDFRLTLADVNLGLLALATDRVEEAVGAVEGEVRVTGTAGAPRFNGGIQVRDGRVRLRGLQTPIESLRLDLRFEDNGIRVTEGTARVGGGMAQLDGAMRLVQGSSAFALVVPPDAPLVLKGSDLHIIYPPVLDARFDGSVRLWGAIGDPQRPPTLDGRVTLSQGTVTVGPVSGLEVQRIPLVFHGLRLDAGRDLAVRVGSLLFGIKPTDPEGSLVLTGTLRAPTLEGTIEAKQGTVVAFGNVFTLEEGTATFQPHLGLRPAVSARAETQVGPTRITLAVHGVAPDDLALDLRSDPDLSRQEIVVLLGQQSGISRVLSGDLAGALRAEIGRLLFGPATLALGRAIGLTELAIDYDFERPLALRAGARLFSNLYLTATTTFSAQQTWLWALEYRFARGWQLALRVDALGQREAIVWYTARF